MIHNESILIKPCDVAEHGVDKINSDSADSAFQQRKFLCKLLVSSACFAWCSSFK